MARRIKTGKYIYDDGAEKLEIKEFQKRYGPQKGKEIYFATVAKISFKLSGDSSLYIACISSIVYGLQFGPLYAQCPLYPPFGV